MSLVRKLLEEVSFEQVLGEGRDSDSKTAVQVGDLTRGETRLYLEGWRQQIIGRF